MQAPQVISRIIIDDNHLHCRSCGQKIPIDSESRFCSDTCDKQQNYLKYLFYGEWLAFIVGSAYTLLGILATFFEFLDICSPSETRHNDCQYRSFTEFLFDEFVLSVFSASILGMIILYFWYFKRLRFVDEKSYPYHKKDSGSKVNAEVQKIEQEIAMLQKKKEKIEEKS